MTKKKAAKTAKKVAKKTVSGAAANELNEAELLSAAVVTWEAEGLLGAVEYLHFDINAAVNSFSVTVQEVSATRGSNRAGNVDASVDLLQRAKKPDSQWGRAVLPASHEHQ